MVQLHNPEDLRSISAAVPCQDEHVPILILRRGTAHTFQQNDIASDELAS